MTRLNYPLWAIAWAAALASAKYTDSVLPVVIVLLWAIIDLLDFWLLRRRDQ